MGIRLDWSEESYDLIRKAENAEAVLRLAGPGDVEELGQQAAEARARADSLFESVTIRALPAADFEALMNAHQPTADQAAKGANFNRDTFFPALLAASVEGPETETDWTEMINSGELVMGEVGTLISVAMELNDRSPSVVLGKGSTTTTS